MLYVQLLLGAMFRHKGLSWWPHVIVPSRPIAPRPPKSRIGSGRYDHQRKRISIKPVIACAPSPYALRKTTVKIGIVRFAPVTKSRLQCRTSAVFSISEAVEGRRIDIIRDAAHRTVAQHEVARRRMRAAEIVVNARAGPIALRRKTWEVLRYLADREPSPAGAEPEQAVLQDTSDRFASDRSLARAAGRDHTTDDALAPADGDGSAPF